MPESSTAMPTPVPSNVKPDGAIALAWSAPLVRDTWPIGHVLRTAETYRTSVRVDSLIASLPFMVTTRAGKFLNVCLTLPPLLLMSVSSDDDQVPAGWMSTSTTLVLLGTSFEYFCGELEAAWVLSETTIPAASEIMAAKPISQSRARLRVVFFDLFL